MTKEEYIKKRIVSSGYNIKSFARLIDIPYSSLMGILNRGIEGASVRHVCKICSGLFINVEELLEINDTKKVPEPFYTSEHEKLLITKYREKPEMTLAIDTLLGIVGDELE